MWTSSEILSCQIILVGMSFNLIVPCFICTTKLGLTFVYFKWPSYYTERNFQSLYLISLIRKCKKPKYQTTHIFAILSARTEIGLLASEIKGVIILSWSKNTFISVCIFQLLQYQNISVVLFTQNAERITRKWSWKFVWYSLCRMAPIYASKYCMNPQRCGFQNFELNLLIWKRVCFELTWLSEDFDFIENPKKDKIEEQNVKALFRNQKYLIS